MTQDVLDTSGMDRTSLGKLVEELYTFLWCECGQIRWDQYWFLKKYLKELCKNAIFFNEETELTKDILNVLQKKSMWDES